MTANRLVLHRSAMLHKGAWAEWRRVIGVVATVALLATLAACQATGPRASGGQDHDSSYEGTELADKRIAPDFRLVDQAGGPVALSDFRGQVVVLTFIDSRCVDVCPFTAVMLRNAAAQLGASSSQVAFLGVNANPFAYDVEDVRLWTEQNRLEEIPGWRFLTGTPQELAPVWQGYFIAVEASAAHNVTHSAGIYLIDRQGQERWYFGVEPDAGAVASMSRLLAQRIQALLREG